MEAYFNRLNLDASLIQPSNIFEMDVLLNAVKKKSNKYLEVSVYKEHVEIIERFIDNVEKSK